MRISNFPLAASIKNILPPVMNMAHFQSLLNPFALSLTAPFKSRLSTKILISKKLVNGASGFALTY